MDSKYNYIANLLKNDHTNIKCIDLSNNIWVITIDGIEQTFNMMDLTSLILGKFYYKCDERLDCLFADDLEEQEFAIQLHSQSTLTAIIKEWGKLTYIKDIKQEIMHSYIINFLKNDYKEYRCVDSLKTIWVKNLSISNFVTMNIKQLQNWILKDFYHHMENKPYLKASFKEKVLKQLQDESKFSSFAEEWADYTYQSSIITPNYIVNLLMKNGHFGLYECVELVFPSKKLMSQKWVFNMLSGIKLDITYEELKMDVKNNIKNIIVDIDKHMQDEILKQCQTPSYLDMIIKEWAKLTYNKNINGVSIITPNYIANLLIKDSFYGRFQCVDILSNSWVRNGDQSSVIYDILKTNVSDNSYCFIPSNLDKSIKDEILKQCQTPSSLDLIMKEWAKLTYNKSINGPSMVTPKYIANILMKDDFYGGFKCVDIFANIWIMSGKNVMYDDLKISIKNNYNCFIPSTVDKSIKDEIIKQCQIPTTVELIMKEWANLTYNTKSEDVLVSDEQKMKDADEELKLAIIKRNNIYISCGKSTTVCNYIYKKGEHIGNQCGTPVNHHGDNKCKFHNHPIFLYEDNENELIKHSEEIAKWVHDHPSHVHVYENI